MNVKKELKLIWEIGNPVNIHFLNQQSQLSLMGIPAKKVIISYIPAPMTAEKDI